MNGKRFPRGLQPGVLWLATLLAAPTSAQEAPAQGDPPAPTNPSDSVDAEAQLDADTPTLPADVTEVPPPPQWQKTMGPPRGAQRLSPEHEIWVHREHGVVVVDGVVAFREGPLEMFACPRGTKEHESIVAVFAKAFQVHAALLAVGAQPGHPVRFTPAYRPAAGTAIEIRVLWVDAGGKRHIDRAQDWIRELRTRRPLDYPWVFAGSGFWEDQQGNQHYQAEAGDLICVSNFATATLDLPIESSQSTGQLIFEAFTDNIPPLGTHVRLVLKPKLEEAAPQEPKTESQPDQKPPSSAPNVG